MTCRTVVLRRLATIGALLLLPSLASAHASLHTSLRRSDPAKGSRLSTAPARIALWFTGPPQLAFSRIGLAGPSGEVALGRLVADTGNGFYANVPRSLEPGEYTVRWQTATADGHPIRGEFTFAIVTSNQATAPRDTAPVSRERHEPRTETISDQSEYRTVRWIEFVALLTVLGVLGFRHGVLPPLAARGVPTADAADRARRLGQSAIFLYAVAAAIRLYTESVAVHGPESALDSGTLVPMVTTTTWGIGWLAGVTGAAFLLLGWTISRRTVTLGTPLALTGALGIVLSPAMSGHATSSNHFVLSVTLDMLHVAAAGVWVGGLLLVLFAGIPAMRRLTNGDTDAAIGALVSSFHPIALFCAPVVVLAGVGTSWIRLGSVNALWTTPYGRTLLVKVGLFACVAMMGTYNALRARRRLGVPDGTRHLRVTASFELVFAALVLAVTTFLVLTPVPSESVQP